MENNDEKIEKDIQLKKFCLDQAARITGMIYNSPDNAPSSTLEEAKSYYDWLKESETFSDLNKTG